MANLNKFNFINFKMAQILKTTFTINFCCANGAMPQHSLNIPDIHILLQKQGGKGMAEHMWCQMLLNPGKFGITCNHKTDGLIR